jgi:hypothetical protein
LIFLIRNYILLVVIIFHFQRIDASNDGGVMVLQEAFASVGGRRARSAGCQVGRAYFRKEMHNELPAGYLAT